MNKVYIYFFIILGIFVGGTAVNLLYAYFVPDELGWVFNAVQFVLSALGVTMQLFILRYIRKEND
ncbi:hypothetical protein [Microcystis phage Mel-JY01]